MRRLSHGKCAGTVCLDARRRMSRSNPRKLLIRISIIFVVCNVHGAVAASPAPLPHIFFFFISFLSILLNTRAIEHCTMIIAMCSLALPMIFIYFFFFSLPGNRRQSAWRPGRGSSADAAAELRSCFIPLARYV